MVSNKGAADTYETPAKINHLTQLIGADSWWGWCVDTAHLWGAGVNIRAEADMEAWLAAIKPGVIKLFHLNGSYAEMGSGADKHAIALGEGDLIWHGIPYQESGVSAIVRYAKKHNIPIVCEINRGKEADCRRLIKHLTAA